MESNDIVSLELKNPRDNRAIAKLAASYIRKGFNLKLIDRKYNEKSKLYELQYKIIKKVEIGHKDDSAK